MFCPMCGAPNEEDADFCGNCGAALTPDDASMETVLEAPEESAAEMAVEAEVVAETSEPAEEIWVEPEAEEAFLEVSAIEASEVEPAPTPSPALPAYQPLAAPQTSGLAVAALVMGIGGLTLIPLVGSILALIFGYMARKDIRQRPDEVTGDGLALAGIVMGWISIGLSVLAIVVFGGLAVCGVCGAFGAGGY
jgi:hypothetical protein